jgi:Zn-dependent protease/CBS domain-containing protein
MGDSLRILRIRGIDIRMHFTFPLILLWGAIQFGFMTRMGLRGALFGVAVTMLLFIIVVFHELGHSFVAQSYGVPVRQIVLLPIGGVAQLGHIPEEPRQEFAIAIAGPMVNFILAGLLALLGSLVGFKFTGISLHGILGEIGLPAMFRYVFISNLFLGVFNLLPAFPMDGGRMLRALMAIRIPYLRATRIAVTIGQGMAWIMGLWGFLGGGFFLILIAFFIYSGARAEGQMVEARSILGGMTVAQAYSEQAQSLSPQDRLRDAVNLTLNSFQSDFPVCEGDQLVGLLTHNRLVEALNAHGPATPVSDVMLRDVEPIESREPLFEAQRKMNEQRLDAMPVVEAGRFRGLITTRDINEAYRLTASEEVKPGRSI